MKHLLIAGAATLGLVSAAVAQTSTTTTTTSGGAVTTGSTSTSVTIEPEVRTKVKQYVTTHKMKSVSAPAGVTISRGAVLPESVELETLPADVGVTQYRYTVVGDRTVLVDNNRRIVEVIE